MNISHPHANNRRAQPGRAFTLVEMLVSVAILSLIVLMLAFATSQVSKAWLLGVSQNERRANGRMLLDFVARDLKMVTLASMDSSRGSSPNATNRGVTPYVYPLAPTTSTNSLATPQFIVNVTTAAGTSNPTFIPTADMNPHALFFQAPVANNTTYGNLAEVGYFVKWDTTSVPGRAIPSMCRFLVNPDPVTSTGNTATTSNFLIYNTASATSVNPVNWLSATVIGNVAPVTGPTYQGWFADNVIALWVRCLDVQGNPIVTKPDGTAYAAYAYDSRIGYIDSGATQAIHYPPALPPAVDIAIITVDSATARRITAKPAGGPGATPATMWSAAPTAGSIYTYMNGLPADIKKSAQLYSTTVYLPNK